MAHGHSHDHHGHSHGHRGHVHTAAHHSKRALLLVCGITTFFLVVEIIGALLTNSLALLADAGHMFADASGLVLALLSIKLAERAATPERTYGYYRAEILAALVNSVLLIGVSFYLFYEAYQRFNEPVEVNSPMMFAVAVIGLAVNVTGLFILKNASKESLSLRGAYLELFADALASVGVIGAAIIIWATGWLYADPIVSVAIGLFILPRTWSLLQEAVGVLLEGTPSDINIASLREAISGVEGVAGAHDLHVWTLSSGVNAMSVHVVLKDNSHYDEVRMAVQTRVTSDFKIAHLTIQVEGKGCAESETHL